MARPKKDPDEKIDQNARKRTRWRVAKPLSVACPTCRAAPNVMCVNTTKTLRLGRVVRYPPSTQYAHTARLELAFKRAQRAKGITSVKSTTLVGERVKL